MESSARRRLDCISRHFSLPHKANHLLLQPALLSNGQLKKWEAEPVIIGGMVLDIHATPSLPPNPRTTTPGKGKKKERKKKIAKELHKIERKSHDFDLSNLESMLFLLLFDLIRSETSTSLSYGLKVNYVLGGVARNVAECMSKLRTKPFMISVLGLDMAGNLLLEYWKSAELSTEGILMQKHIKTAVVSNIFNPNGEVAAGVASVEAIENFLTPEWIERFKHNIHSAPILIVDANLNLPALEASSKIAAASNIPVWFEPVSVAKSRRIVSIAKYVSFASPNEDELIAMANALSGGDIYSYSPTERDNSRDKQSIESLFQMLKPAIWVLLKNGIKFLVVTLGPDGVFLCSKGGPSFMKIHHERNKRDNSHGVLYKIVTAVCSPNQILDSAKPESNSHLFAVHFPALHASVVRLTGAGDCLVGGTLSSICDGLDVMQSVAVGIAASKAAVEAESNVPTHFDLSTIADDARLVYYGAKVVCHESMAVN